MYPARVENRDIVYDTCVRMEPRASPEPSTLLRDEGPHGPQYNQRSIQLDPAHPQSVVGPHKRNAGILVAQEDVDEAVNKATTAQLKDEAALQRATQADRAANEIGQSK